MSKRLEDREKIVAEVMKLRKAGLLFPEIGKRLGIHKETARYLFKRGFPHSIRTAKPDREKLPLMTMAGTLWNWPPIRPHGSVDGNLCAACGVVNECRASVDQGGFVGCERPLEREMMR